MDECSEADDAKTDRFLVVLLQYSVALGAAVKQYLQHARTTATICTDHSYNMHGPYTHKVQNQYEVCSKKVDFLGQCKPAF